MIAAVILTLLVVVYRVVLGNLGTPDTAAAQWLHNFSPLASVALCGAIYFPRRLAVVFPLGAVLISDLLLNAHYHVPLLNPGMLPQYLALGLVSAAGFLLRRDPKIGPILLGSVGGSVLFHLLTNTGAWLMLPEYAKTTSGWWQALTVGLPDHTPTWLFFRNTLLSDLVFTGLFVACMHVTAEPRSREAALART